MKPFPVRIGLDEVATETQKCDGFAFFCLPEAFVPEFAAETSRLLDAGGLPGFHAKKFKAAHAAAYRDFLSLAHAFIRRSPQAFAACRLFSDKVKANLLEFGDRVVKGSVEKALGAGHPAVQLLRPYFLPLASLAVLARELAPSVEMRVEMDEHSSFANLGGAAHHAGPVAVTAGTLLKGLYNGYAKGLHARTPLLPDDGVKVMRDSKSALIQAADVIGNFAMAHMFARLGDTSKKRTAKASILVDAFGSDVDAFDAGGKATLAGNDFVLVNDGSFTFKAGWQIVTPPTARS